MDSLNILTQTKVQTKEPVYTTVSRQDTKQQGTPVPTQEVEQEKKGVTGTDLFPPTQMRSLSGGPPPVPPVPITAPMLAVSGPSLLMNPLTQVERRETRSDVERMRIKQGLAANVIANLTRMEHSDAPASLFRTLQKLVEYLGMDVTAQSDQAQRDREAALLGEVIANLERIKGNLNGQEKKAAEYYLEYLKKETNGYLKEPTDKSRLEDWTKGRKRHIVAKLKSTRKLHVVRVVDKRNEPLFPHEPSISDIVQGRLGDCYLLAGLASVVHSHPEKIKGCMRDNGDGTVTVRFYDWDISGKRSEVYIKIKKEVPVYDTDGGKTVDAYARGSLWVQMIEKAYAASGLHPEFDSKRHKIKREHIKDKKGWRPAYQDIAGGFAGNFIAKITGQKAQEIQVEEEVEKEDPNVIMGIIKKKAMLEEFTGWPSKLQESAFIGKKVVSTVVAFTRQGIATAIKNIKKSLLAGEFHTEINKAGAALLRERIRERINALSPNLFPTSATVPSEIRMTQGEVDTLKINLANWLINRIEALSFWKNLRTGPLFGDHSEYSENMEELYRMVQDYTAQDVFLTASAKKNVHGMKGGIHVSKTGGGVGKSAGEPIADGMVGSHAYTVIGTKQIGNVKYIIVRNPWASSARSYLRAPDGSIWTQKESEADGGTGGIWLVELGDFAHNFYRVGVNK